MRRPERVLQDGNVPSKKVKDAEVDDKTLP
jgi:hypothetical protein